MDPISAVLAAVIEQGAGTVAAGMRSALGTDVTSVVVEYQGYQVPFSYQMWQLKPKSVCDTYRSDVAAFSGCTVAAKSLFGALCKELQEKPSATLSYGSLKNLYCTAAVSFQPTHATVQWSAQSQTDDARQECRLAQAALLAENTPETRKRREVACGKTAKSP
jgi:hypothetical protein